MEWSNKMRDLQNKGYKAKDALNLKKGAAKLSDLDFLEKQIVPGPFSTSQNVEALMNSEEEPKKKQDLLYIEVWYAKTTSLSMNTKALSKVFRLRRDGKKL